MVKTAEVRYLLSEDGRRKSLLAGGDGERVQVLEVPADERVINLAKISDSGNVSLCIGFHYWNNIGPEILDQYMEVNTSGEPVWITKKEVYEFPEPQTLEALLEWEEARRARVESSHKVYKEQYQPLKDKYDADELARRKALDAEQEEKYRRQREESARMEEEKASWITAHGSEFLKRAFGAGYNCQRMYVTERASMELTEFVVDFDRNACWDERCCPSEVALDDSLELISRGYNASVVWLTCDVNGNDIEDGAEAVVVKEYLGRYFLIKE